MEDRTALLEGLAFEDPVFCLGWGAQITTTGVVNVFCLEEPFASPLDYVGPRSDPAKWLLHSYLIGTHHQASIAL